MGMAGFTHSGQPGQRLRGVSGSGCQTPALSEQSSRWGPQRVHTPGTQGGPRPNKTLGRETAAPFAFFNQSANNWGTSPESKPRLPPCPHAGPQALAAHIIVELLRAPPPSRSHYQLYRNLFLLLSSYFCFCHHGRSVWVLSPSQGLFIFSRSLKSLYVLPGAGLRNNLRFLSE